MNKSPNFKWIVYKGFKFLADLENQELYSAANRKKISGRNGCFNICGNGKRTTITGHTVERIVNGFLPDGGVLYEEN